MPPAGARNLQAPPAIRRLMHPDLLAAAKTLGVVLPTLPDDLDTAAEVFDTWKAGPLKTAWKTAAKVHHPDVGGNPQTFKTMSAAYDLLRDAELRVRTPEDDIPAFVQEALRRATEAAARARADLQRERAKRAEEARARQAEAKREAAEQRQIREEQRVLREQLAEIRRLKREEAKAREAAAREALRGDAAGLRDAFRRQRAEVEASSLIDKALGVGETFRVDEALGFPGAAKKLRRLFRS